MLTVLASDWNELIRDLDHFASDEGTEELFTLTPAQRGNIIERLGRIKGLCDKFGFELSASYANEIAVFVTRSVTVQQMTISANETVLDPTKFKNEISILRKRINDELKGAEFFALDSKTGGYFKKDKLFGEEVFNNFPSANNDIYDAGTCLALGCTTACVMHSMRALEVALTVLTKELGLPPRHDWGKHLANIENELTKRYKTSGSRTPDELFFSEAAAQIGHVKTAWRNPTMHVDRSYGDDHAEEILMAVRSLLRHLATRLHE